MQAMVLNAVGTALRWTELPDRHPGPGEMRVQVAACGVCRTDLHVVDGELAEPAVPIIPGHEIVGRIDAVGAGVTDLQPGARVGIPWLGHTCGVCPYCLGQQENLCDRPLFTGYTRDGGFATAVIADARYAFPLGEAGDDVALAPLLCAGLIGWRALGSPVRANGWGCMVSVRRRISLPRSRAGRGARCSPSRVRAMPPRRPSPAASARPGRADPTQRRRSRSTPRSSSPRRANWCRSRCSAVRKGGRVVCAGIHMSDIPGFPYRLLWEERQLRVRRQSDTPGRD